MQDSQVPRFDGPSGRVRDAEWRFEREMLSALASGQLGVRGGGLFGALSEGLDLLAGVAGCRWQCRGGQHTRENLYRRFINASLAAIKLSLVGYHDEALALVRVAAEAVNSLQLFTDAAWLRAWEDATESDRKQRFAPVNVRKALEEAGMQPIFDRTAYAALSEAGVHLTPESARRSHDIERSKVFVGPFPSVPGMFLVWTELGVAVGGCLSIAIRANELPVEHREPAESAIDALRAAVGRGDLRASCYEEVLRWFRESARGQ